MHVASLFSYTQKLEEVLNVLFFLFYRHQFTLMRSKYELTDMYTLYRSPAGHRHDHTSSYYWHPKKFSVLPTDGSLFLILEFPPTNAGFLLQESQGICQRIKKSQRNLIFFGKTQGKVREENFYPCKLLSFKKTICMQK